MISGYTDSALTTLRNGKLKPGKADWNSQKTAINKMATDNWGIS